MTVRLVPARWGHIRPIAQAMRQADAIECAASGRTPLSGLRLSLKSSSFALTALVDGKPHAMMGVIPQNLAERFGVPWFLGTDEVFRHGRALLRYGPQVVALMQDSFRRLENVVSADNRCALALLRRLGFEVGSEVVLQGGVPFVRFWRGQ